MAVNVRVEAKPLSPNATKEERTRNFKILFSIFKKAVKDSGVLEDFRNKQFYESKAQKIKRKAKEARLRRLREENGFNNDNIRKKDGKDQNKDQKHQVSS